MTVEAPMQGKHLRPDEIELLLDGEEGFGVATLWAHAASCATCQAQLDKGRELMVALDSLPDFAPSRAFADSVMSEVHVFEPWYAALARNATSVVPSTRVGRIAAGLGAAITAGLGTAAATWAVARADMAFILTQLGLEQFRVQFSAAVSDLVRTVVGQQGLDQLSGSSPETIALVLGGFVAAAGIGVVGIRALVTPSKRLAR